MSTVVKEVRNSKKIESTIHRQTLAEKNASDLALAKSRKDGEFTSADEFISYLRR